ncbi:GGDEF domain-containing response regulator [Thauera phenolivorans]|nr:diguanylate cyclase [Thauera phenolivorans]
MTEALPRILVVDDSRMVRSSIIKHIRGRFEVREEGDGEAAWEALLVDPAVQLVLTDIGMPRLDGYGLLERIRSARVARISSLPVLIISGEEDDSARERAAALGANGFITKGSGSAELLSALESLLRLAQTERELEASRAALARQSAIDPVSGLVNESYLKWRAEQDLAYARRHGANLSVLVVEIDRFRELVERHGAQVAGLVGRKLSEILASRVRSEDSVAQLSPAQFVLLAHGSELAASCAFALRLQQALEKLVLSYRGERIGITVTIGVANSAVDGLASVSELIGVAVGRAENGRAAGGNRVFADRGEVSEVSLASARRELTSIDAVLRQLQRGDTEAVAARLPAVIAALAPLLDLIESRLGCDIPLSRLKQIDKEAGVAGVNGGAVHPMP